MLGTIGFKRYRVSCIIGIEPHERKVEQNLLIDLKVEIDFTRVATSSQLQDTIDYVSIAAVCKDMAKQGKYLLIEKFAADLVKEVLKKFPVKSVAVRVEKPKAIVDADCAFVELKCEA